MSVKESRVDTWFVYRSFFLEPVHQCQRECDDGPARRCIYDFHVEYYFTMSKACYDCPHSIEDCDRHHCIPADGVERGVVVINRQLPGPSIQVRLLLKGLRPSLNNIPIITGL